MEGLKSGKSEALEVTGVSRSGRVRKKSSKLMDFESSDEVETKSRKRNYSESTPKPEKSRKPVSKMYEEEDPPAYTHQTSGGGHSDEEAYRPDEDEYVDKESDDPPEDSDDDDDYTEGNLVVDEKTPTQSLYLMEKNKKRYIYKDGKVVQSHKSQRKDKGKSRFTAYMMWSKEVRQELLKQFPDMDFSTTARRLSEMWATVPKSEREHWKRKAKREGLKKNKAKPEAPLMPSRKFINKKGGPIAPLHSSSAPYNIQKQMAAPTPQAQPPPADPISPKKVSVETSPLGLSASYKVTGTAPIDVAAHLNLLGECLSIIGERLQEHEGQIAVSGSLSVLLDSLICSMGPLLCLTQQIPALRTDPEPMAKTLQNIAYIMPGIG